MKLRYSYLVVVGGTVLHAHAYAYEGGGVNSPPSDLIGRSGECLIGERVKGAVCNLISKKALFL